MKTHHNAWRSPPEVQQQKEGGLVSVRPTIQDEIWNISEYKTMTKMSCSKNASLCCREKVIRNRKRNYHQEMLAVARKRQNELERTTIVGRTDLKYQIHKDRKEFNTPNMTQLAGIV